MALNKRKVLETARKHAQKGAKAKALKEYNQLLQADPRDAKLLLEVGDAYRRWGQAEEAIAQYAKVAQQYRQDGFDARAVAVFKQILNLDPKHFSAYVSLSELYQRMGLDSEAISALQTAADGYHKEGRKSEALDLLRQMAALDPTNTTSRLKVAELLRQEGMTVEALAEYEAVAVELENQDDRDQLLVVLERILELEPDKTDALTSLVRNLMAAGDLDRAEPIAVRAMDVSQEPAQYELLIELYAQMGRDSKVADATRGLARLYRERGDEEKARELMQRLPAEEVESSSSSSRLAVDVSEVAEPDLADDDLLEEEPFLTLGEDEELTAGPIGTSADRSIEQGVAASDAPAATPAASSAPSSADTGALPEGDPDQLLAEASVYLRYGKKDQAIASLRGVIAQDPDHRGALEKLGEAYAEGGQAEEAVAVWLRAAEQVRRARDSDGLAILRDRIAALDPAAAEQIGAIEEVATGDVDDLVGEDSTEVAPPSLDLELDVEIDLDLDSAIDEVAESDTQTGFGLVEDEDEFEIELDDDSVTFDEPPVAEAASTEDTSPVFDVDLDDDDSIEFELDGNDLLDDAMDAPAEEHAEERDGDTDADDSFEFELDADDFTAPAGDSVAGHSTTSTAGIEEEIEEAEFYIAQDMFDEAEAILARILEMAPNHPSAMLRIGEIEAARGSAPEAAVGQASATVERTTRDLDSTTRFDDDDATMGEAELALAAAADDSSTEFEVDLDDSGIGFDLDEDDTADIAEATSPDPVPVVETPVVEPETRAASVEADVTAAAASASQTSQIETQTIPKPVVAEPVRMPADPGETFDLREALEDVFADDDAPMSPDESGSGVLSTVEDGFESIFSDFKKGVSAQLEEGDYDTRYDLGIAYREMGLYEDAIGEFRVCLDSSTRRFDSLYLMGLCARDLQRFDDAVNHLEQALALPDLPAERMAGVYFDLSIAEQGAGDLERARATVRRVIEIEAGFPGAAERLAALEADEASSPQLAAERDGFESFEELFDEEDDEGGDQAMAEAVPVETFESFDDLVSEAEAVLDQAVPARAEIVSGDAADSEEDPSSSKGGRKKISFV